MSGAVKPCPYWIGTVSQLGHLDGKGMVVVSYPSSRKRQLHAVCASPELITALRNSWLQVLLVDLTNACLHLYLRAQEDVADSTCNHCE